jgi:ABC-2 type transport system permease protein
MRKILKIAKVELNVLFYSPVAWLLLAVFLVQCSVHLFGGLLATRTQLSSGYRITSSLTASLLSTSPGGLASAVLDSLYMYMPILTMGLMSRETSSGSIKLLQSSPVKIREIVLGKYLAIITFGLAFVAIVACCDLAGFYAIESADVGLMLAALLSIYVLLCAYAAIGLFMSCLTSYQIVAFISTIAVFGVMGYVNVLWQDIDFVRDLTYFLSISGRAEKMGGGLITTRDVFYFLIIIVSFLIMSGLKLKSSMESKPWHVHAAKYAALAVCALGLGYVTSRPTFTGYLDVTAQKSRTITEVSQEIARKFAAGQDAPRMTTYANLLAPNVWEVLPAERNVDRGKWENYQRFIPDMEMSYVYYYQFPVDPRFDDLKGTNALLGTDNRKALPNVQAFAERAFRNMGISGRRFLSPAQIDAVVDLKPEGYLPLRRLEYQGKSSVVRFYVEENIPDVAFEQEANAAFKRLLVAAPKVVFLTGNNARVPDSNAGRHYSNSSNRGTRRPSLVNQGFDIGAVDLARQEIPADASLVVLADPTLELTAADQAKVEAYLARGGNMLIAGEPGRQRILNPLLNGLGVQLEEGMAVVADRNLTPGFLRAKVSKDASRLGSFMDSVSRGEDIEIQGAAALDYHANARFSIQPLLWSPAESWKETALEYSPVTGEIDTDALTPGAGSAATASRRGQKASPIALALSRNLNGNEQRVIVSGDADFMSNVEIDRRPPPNVRYFHGLFQWLSGGEFPVYTTRPDPADVDLLMTRETLKTLGWIFKAGLPALVVLAGVILLFRRRAK